VQGKIISFFSRRHASLNFSLLEAGVSGDILAFWCNASQNTEAFFLYPVSEGTTPANPYWGFVSDIVVSTVVTDPTGTGRGAAFADGFFPFPSPGLPFHDGIRVDKVISTTSFGLIVRVKRGHPKWLVSPEI